MVWFLCLLVNIVTVNCLSAPDIIERVEAVAGRPAELPCNVTAVNDDRLTILAWYKDQAHTAFYSSRDFRGDDASSTPEDDSGTTPGEEGGRKQRYRLITGDPDALNKLQIVSVRPRDKGIYMCLADFAASPSHKTYSELIVLEPPDTLWVVNENGTHVAKSTVGVNTSQNIGPYYVGDTVRLTCVVFGGKPRPSISWWSEERLLKNKSTLLSESRARSDLNYGPLQREDHGRVFSCLATNDKSPPLYVDIVLDMYLPPDLVTLRSDGSGGRVQAGETLTLQCRVLGARPLPPLVWRLGDNQLLNLEQNITMEPSQRLVVSEITLNIDKELDEAHITCCAPAQERDGKEFTCAQALPLTVLYPPVLEIVVEDTVENNTLSVVKGSDFSMACNYKANPSVFELYWFHKDNFVKNHSGSNNAKPVQPLLRVEGVTEENAGDYYCVASNLEGSTSSKAMTVIVTYPAFCKVTERIESGVGEDEEIQLNCTVEANPSPASYRWVIVNETVDPGSLADHQYATFETEKATLSYKRPNETAFSTIFCWGQNDVPSSGLPNTPCSFLVTDQTIPHPPHHCEARKSTSGDVSVVCKKGYDGGLSQRFRFMVQPVDSDEHLMSIESKEPEFMFAEPKDTEDYKFIIIAFNSKGDSESVEIEKNSIIDEATVAGQPGSTVKNITALSLALCGGVLLVALAACGLVLCAHERAARPDLPRDRDHPPLCAYNTEESNCDTYHDSDDGSECNVRRTESFRRAVSRHPSKNFDVRRTSSFHSARYMHDATDHDTGKCSDIVRHNCRGHSLQNISRKRDMDALCDHLVLHLPPETNYNVPRPMNTFYTMPRKMRQKLAKELSDDHSEITQTSDGFSLPPPPDEFTSYRAGTRIKDMPTKAIPTYTTVRKNSTGRDPTRPQYNNVIMSPLNTVGLPTSGQHNSVYAYPDDHHQDHQSTNPFDEDSS